MKRSLEAKARGCIQRAGDCPFGPGLGNASRVDANTIYLAADRYKPMFHHLNVQMCCRRQRENFTRRNSTSPCRCDRAAANE